jgi:hypothetical protein
MDHSQSDKRLLSVRTLQSNVRTRKKLNGATNEAEWRISEARSFSDDFSLPTVSNGLLAAVNWVEPIVVAAQLSH